MIVSPHLDDAVLSCGQLMAGRPDCLVVTVFAGLPDPPVSTTYDVACGFADSTAAMRDRHTEDELALRRLGATAHRMDWLDGQYRREGVDELWPVDGIYADLLRVWEWHGQPDVVAPLGIKHPDHTLAAWACMKLVPHLQAAESELAVYEELPGRVLWPELAALELESWREATPLELGFIGTGPRERKAYAIAEYASQTELLFAMGDGGAQPACFVPERYWVMP